MEKDYVQKLINKMKRDHKGFPANKECYINCILLTLESKGELTYCEGLYWDMIPTEHAWLKINDKYFDPTALWNKRFKDKIQYFGMEFPFEDVKKYGIDLKNGTAGCIAGKIFLKNAKSKNP